jgi:hypothetical protein
MIGLPQNNFQTMQSPQTLPQPRNVMLGNAMQNMPNNQAKPNMLAPSQYGNPTPQMGNMQMPQSNVGYNLQPPIPNMNQAPQGPIGMNQQGQNRFGVGLASPRQMPQATQVS